MNLKQMLEVLNVTEGLSDDSEYERACKIIMKTQALSHGAKDNLRALFKEGPLFDGHELSKAGKYELIDCGFAKRVIVNGEGGYTACTYDGAKAYDLINSGDFERDTYNCSQNTRNLEEYAQHSGYCDVLIRHDDRKNIAWMPEYIYVIDGPNKDGIVEFCYANDVCEKHVNCIDFCYKD